MEHADTASTMARIVSELEQASGEQSTVEAIVVKARDLVSDAAFVSLTVMATRQRYETVVASSDVAEQADRAQYELNEGPCVTAARDAEWIRSGDVDNDHRWTRWGPVAASMGIGSLLSVPLHAQGLPAGALNFYALEVGRFNDKADVDVALIFAVHAAHAFRTARQMDGLEVALSSRHNIGVAQGIVMERYGLDLDRSFSLLRRLSSHTNTKLTTIARDIVSTGRVPSLDETE